MAMLLRSLKARVIARGARNYRAYADLAVAYEEREWESNGTRNRVLRMPSGPAAVITPWNAPFMLSTWKMRARPRRRLHGRPQAGRVVAAVLLAARRPDRRGRASRPASSTSCRASARRPAPRSSRTPACGASRSPARPRPARHIGRAAAENIVPFTGELGGKGPLLVFADADLDAAAAKAAGQYDDAGQVCLAGHAHPRRGVGPRAVPGALARRHRPARPGRSARRRDDGLAADPPRPPRARRGVRRARAGQRRPHRARRPPSPSAAASGTSRR